MPRPALALALLLCAPCAWALDKPASAQFIAAHPKLIGRLIGELKLRLGEVPPLKEHADFVRRSRVPFLSAPPNRFIGPSDGEAVAIWTEHAMYLNETTAMAWAEELAALGIPGDALAAALSWKMVPILAHELRHGIVEEDLARLVGADCGSTFMENELVPILEEVSIVRWLAIQRPQTFHLDYDLAADRQSGLLLQGTALGYDAFVKVLVAERYEAKISIFKTTRAEQHAKAKALGPDMRKMNAKLRDIVGRAERLESEIADKLARLKPGEEQARPVLEADLGKIRETLRKARSTGSEHQLARFDTYTRECAPIFETEGDFRKMRRYYSRMIRRMKRKAFPKQ